MVAQSRLQLLVLHGERVVWVGDCEHQLPEAELGVQFPSLAD